jgi:hypothetical protein
MSWLELRAGVGLLLELALIIGWSLGFGLPLAALIIWLLDLRPPVLAASLRRRSAEPYGHGAATEDHLC